MGTNNKKQSTKVDFHGLNWNTGYLSNYVNKTVTDTKRAGSMKSVPEIWYAYCVYLLPQPPKIKTHIIAKYLKTITQMKRWCWREVCFSSSNLRAGFTAVAHPAEGQVFLCLRKRSKISKITRGTLEINIREGQNWNVWKRDWGGEEIYGGDAF